MFRRNGDPELVMQVDDAILALRARLEILLESDFQMTDGEEENYRHLFSLAGVQFTQSSSLISRFTERTFAEQVGYEEDSLSGRARRAELEKRRERRRNAEVAP
jgi:hypothetical protein